MNAERLLQHYEQIAEAPDAIARLRRFILDLAVRGKLVPQDFGDEPASELLKRIAAEKASLLDAGKLKAEKPVKQAFKAEEQYGLPALWRWADLQAVCLSITDGDHLPPPRANKGVPFLVIGDVRDKTINYDCGRFVERAYYEKLDVIRRPKKGDILYTLVGSFGIPVPVREDREFCVQRHIGILRPSEILPVAFLTYTLESNLVFRQADKFATGIAQRTVPLAGLRAIQVPLPPLAEQHRIVAKVDELMALCDELEAARTERETKRDRLAAASLARLNSPDPETFRDNARFALDALPALTARPDQIKQLRQAILNLAVRGKLSVSEGWVDKPVRVGDVASLQNGYAFKSEWFAKSGTRLVRNANVGHGKLNWAEEVRLPESLVPEFERFRLSEGDIVVSLDRPFIVTGTKVARISSDDLPALLLQRVGRFVLTPNVCADFLYLWINSPHFNEQIDPGRSNGVPHISSKQVESATIFIPPLAEQHRIVAKVDELMALCDQLETSLTSADETRKKLLDALLAEALAPVNAETLQEAAE